MIEVSDKMPYENFIYMFICIYCRNYLVRLMKRYCLEGYYLGWNKKRSNEEFSPLDLLEGMKSF